jgi:glycosyltransferase involved in cell wall biosynthesis
MKNIKVYHITTVHTPKDIRILLKECTSISKAGFVTELLVAGGKEDFEHKGVRVSGLNLSYSSRVTRVRKAPRATYRIALQRNADIYHFHDPEFLPFGRKLARRGKIVIYDAHENVPEQILEKFWIPKLLRKTIAALVRRYENRTAKKIAHVVTATPAIRDRFLKITQNVTDINNYPLPDEMVSGTDDTIKKEQVCYVGGITRIRGVKEMVKAMEDCSCKLMLGGGFESPALREELIATEGWKNVEELGVISREKMVSVLAGSRAGFVLFHPVPNHIDAQPNKLFEYMSAKLPVIASHFPLWKKIIEGNECGICVDPMNPNAIAEAVNYILQHPEEAKKMGENGRRAVERQYNWQIEEKKLISLYRSLVQEKI